MGKVDRQVRRAQRRLADGELVLSSLGAVCPEGGPRVLLATDRRVLLCGRRTADPVELPLTASATFDAARRRLSLADGDRKVILDDVDPIEGRQLVRLLGHRQDISLSERIGAPFHVRIVAPSDDS